MIKSSRRRSAHYAGQEKNKEKSFGAKVFFQLIICMLIMTWILFGGSKNLPYSKEISGFARDVIHRNIDFSSAFSALHSAVEKKFGKTDLPAATDGVFTETTPDTNTKTESGESDAESL